MTTKDPAAVALGMRRWANRTPHPCANCGTPTLAATCSPRCKVADWRKRKRSTTQQQLDELAATLGIPASEVLAAAVAEAHAKYSEP